MQKKEEKTRFLYFDINYSYEVSEGFIENFFTSIY